MKVLIASKIHDFFVSELHKNGFACTTQILKNSEELLHYVSKYDGVVINSRFALDRSKIDQMLHLKFVARIGSGMENIDTAYLEAKGIAWFNSPEGNRQAVGEHALGMLLNLFNKINIADRQVREGKWIREANRGTEISGKTIGIIGYGNTGSAFAKCLSGFDAKILAYDKYKSGFSNEYVQECSLEEIFELANVLSLHVPLTEETTFMVDDNFINSFKKNIYVINTSRGKVLNTASLVKHLQQGKILGACLDVIEYEILSFENVDFEKLPEPFQYLIKAENVILTPHIAGWTFESNFKHAQVLAQKILNHFL